MMKPKFRCRAKEGAGIIRDVSNREGYCTEVNKVGLVMFYPDGGFPYCVCLSEDEVELI